MTVTRQEIAAEQGLTMVRAAIDHAKSKGWEITAAVCDPRGGLVAFLRTDDVISPAIEFAMDKAFTAATLRKASGEFGERMASKPTLSLGVGTRERLLTWHGGLPVFDGDICIGGIGVSGAADHEDLECAEIAIKLAGFRSQA